MCSLWGEVQLMKLTKSQSLTEAQTFIEKFKGKRKYEIEFDSLGKIIEVITTDKDIIKHTKELGLK